MLPTAKAFAFPVSRRKLSPGCGMADETEHTGAPEAPDAAGDAGPAPACGEPPPLPLTATALANKAKDLQALRDALVDAASVRGPVV